MKKLSNNTQAFFKYIFKGNGKYYLTEQGSRSYKNTIFSKFYNKNSELIDIVARGNDAPRGGRTGDFVIVEFNKKFFEKYQWVFDYMEEEKRKAEQLREERNSKLNEIGNQEEMLRGLFKSNPDFLNLIKNRIENYSSKKWRNWVVMK